MANGEVIDCFKAGTPGILAERAGRRRYRTFWRRFAAGLVDGIIFFPLYWLDRWIWEAAPAALLVPWHAAHSASFVLYSVLLHGCFGQTAGKWLMRVKVYDVSGARLSMRQAVLRDIVYIALVVYGLAIELPLVAQGGDPYDPEREPGLAMWISVYASVAWFALEIVTMLSNRKRRAVHDFIAGSVVMRVDRG